MADTDLHASLLTRIEAQYIRLAVIGLGYVGLPVAAAFADADLTVVGIDVDAQKVDWVSEGQSYIADIPSETLERLVGSGRLSATTCFDALDDADAIIICVPTPLSKTRDPDISYIVAAADEVAAHLHRGQLVVLESTTYPGTTEEILLPRLERDGLEVGVDVFLAFSPERIDPGNQRYHLANTPKVLGGMTPACHSVAKAMYELAIDRVVSVDTPATAEMVKLLENTFRAVNIGLINEVALMCDRLGIDVWQVIEAASTKPYGFMTFYPGPGLGGHCIPLDPEYLAWKLRTLHYTARFVQLAAEVNTSMPDHVAEMVTDALNDRRKAVNGSRVLVLGVAYKANVGDLRESPALDILRQLKAKGAKLYYHDPHVPEVHVGELHLHSSELSDALLTAMDCAVVITAHDAIDWAQVVAHAPVIVDTRNATSRVRVDGGAEIIKL